MAVFGQKITDFKLNFTFFICSNYFTRFLTGFEPKMRNLMKIYFGAHFEGSFGVSPTINQFNVTQHITFRDFIQIQNFWCQNVLFFCQEFIKTGFDLFNSILKAKKGTRNSTNFLELRISLPNIFFWIAGKKIGRIHIKLVKFDQKLEKLRAIQWLNIFVGLAKNMLILAIFRQKTHRI